jgi:hypothetical protein
MENYIKLLKEEWTYLQLAEEQLDYSHLQLQNVNPDVELNNIDLVQIEAYTARFARVLDIYTQKILKTIDVLEGYGGGSLRDILNRSEKAGIIDSANYLLSCRILRNEIAHDYIPNQQRKIFVDVRDKYTELKSAIQQTRSFLKQTGWLSV